MGGPMGGLDVGRGSGTFGADRSASCCAWVFVVLAVATLLGPPARGGSPERMPLPYRADQYGDPLPVGAVARLGSVRLRHAGLQDFALLPDGKTAVTVGQDQ